MVLTRMAKLGVVLIGGLLLSLSAIGNEVEVVNRTDLFGQGKGKKPVKVGTANPGERYKVISTKGAWTAINFNGKSVWIAGKNVKPTDDGDREVASSGTSYGSTGESKLSVHGDLGIQTGGTGFGPGIGAYYKAYQFSPKLRLDAGPSLFFFPSGGTVLASVSGFEFLVNGRLMYSLAPKMEVGGELGLVYLSFGTPSVAGVPVTGATGSSNIGVNLGGAFTYEFSKQWHALANVRMVFAGGSAALISGGVEYKF